jgi:hypothetical protein
MSLKTDFLDGANGFTQKMATVYAAGQQFVVDNRAALQAELETNAAQGNKTFTVTLLTAFEPANLRLEGNHMRTYFSGIRDGLLGEEIYEHEVTISLNTSDLNDTSVDLTFTL